MELPLDELPNKREELLAVGAVHARDVHALCNDVAAMVFPSAITPPTEATISAVTGKLVALVSDIESRLQISRADAAGGLPGTWQLLARSGFLREADLVDFMLARVAEDRLEAKIPASTPQLSAQLLAHADANIAEAAQSLLAADSLHRRTRGLSYQALRPELLHRLCWRVVAALEVGNGRRDEQVVENARALISDYDEGQTALTAAHKLVHFLDEEYLADLLDPEKAGLHIYVARLAQGLQIDHDHVLHLIDSHSSAPLGVMLRAVGCNAEQAMASIYLFKGFSLTPRDVALFERGFEVLEQDIAHAEVCRWGYARAQYLAFQQKI
ncbi:MAG: hypothetical protein ABI668_03545 [Sphingorhabdus sp.]